MSERAARCATCHAELFDGKATVHAATEDCGSCHEVTLDERGTTITLADSEPGLCLGCHAELAPAAAGDLAHPHPVVAEGCGACHSPHASAVPRLLLAREGELCAGCHALESLAAPHGGLLSSGTACARCHAPHGGAEAKLLAGARQHAPFADRSCDGCHLATLGERVRLQARGQRLCLACHDDPAAGDALGSVHAALADDARGRAGCLSCHRPHLAAAASLLVRAGVELCADCHGAIARAAAAATGHAPAAEDCGSCHRPHAAAEPVLLRAPRAELCAECHDRADGELTARHLGADLARLDCLACHSPHGAGQRASLHAHVHAPLLDGCDGCHDGSAGELVEGGGAALCGACHDDVLAAAAASPVPHAAMEMDACTSCHAAHASSRPKLAKSPPASACTECHAEQVAGAGEIAHGAIALLGCEGCHEPHGGSRPRLLRAEGSGLCLACHDEGALAAAAGGPLPVFGVLELPAGTVATLARLRLSADGSEGHPVRGHRVLGKPTPAELHRTTTTFSAELTCLTCHEPHKGRSPGLFQWGAASATEVCLQCHPK